MNKQLQKLEECLNTTLTEKNSLHTVLERKSIKVMMYNIVFQSIN